MNSHSIAPSWIPPVKLLLNRLWKIAILLIVALASAILVPTLSAQTLLMRFPFNEVGTNTVDSVSGISLGIYNASGVLTDLHGGPGTGPAGLGNSLDFASATAGNGNNPVAYTLTNSTVNFGTIGAFTVTMWIKPTGAINFARFFGLGTVGDLDNGSANSLSIQGDGNNVGCQAGVNTANSTFASGISLPQNGWTFLAYTYDGSSVLQVYTANTTTPVWAGQLVTAANAGGNVNIGSTFDLWIGNRPSNLQRGFPAYFADVRLYSGVATSNFLDTVRQAALPNPVVSATIISPSSTSVGALVAISAASGGTQPITNQWYFVSNGVTNAIVGATNTTYYIQSAQVTNSGSYFMVAANSAGIYTNTPATLSVGPLAGAGVQILDFGNAAPVPGTYDIPQLVTNGESTAGNGEDGLNYFSDNSPAPGQTFATGSNPNGYVINGVYVRTAGINSGSGGTTTAQPYTIRIYSVSGSTATLLSTYVSTNSLAFPDGDWVLYSGGFTNILQPNSTYAYSYHENTGYDELGYNTTNPYPSGEMCEIPTAGGAITFCSSGNSDAAFDIALSTTPTTPIVSQQPAGQTVVVGQPVNFSVGVVGITPTYQWFTSSDTNYSNPNVISGATSSTYSIASPTTSNATNYFVVIDGSVTSAVATLTVRLSVNTLAWLGSSSFNWDLTTANWSNTVSQLGGYVYQTGDNVNFTDAGKASSPINLTAALSPTSVTAQSTNTYIFNGAGSLAGNVQLAQNGSGVLIISNNNTFLGSTTIGNGILRLANANALGNQTNAVTINGGTLDLNGVAAPTTFQYNIQGSGNTNEGAINNSSATAIQNGNGIRGVNLTGNATIGAVGRWDLNGDGGGAGLQGNNFNLTKVGTGSTFFIDAGTNNHLDDITIVGGSLGFQGSNNLGNAANNIYVDSGATLAFYGTAQGVPLIKNSITMSNAFMSNGGTNLTLNTPIVLLGTNTIQPGFGETVNMSDTFNSPITGTGGLVINSIQQYIFAGTNTYSGETIVNGNGTLLTVEANSSLGNSSPIEINSSTANIDLSQIPGLMLNSGQLLSGIGNIYGNVTNGPGSILAPGVTGPGTLTLASGSLTLASATVPIELGSDPTQFGNGVNSFVSVAGNLTLNGLSTIQVSPVGSLSSSQPYTVLQYGGSLSGTAANLQVSGSNSRYTISLVDPTTTPGSVEVSVTGIAANLIWRGGNGAGPNIWNQTIQNFFNTGTSAADQFFNGDNVVFDDTGVTNIVNVTLTNIPGSLTFSNNVHNYTFVGVGNIQGTLSQQGTGTVTIAISNTPALTGIINNAGTLAFNLPINATLTAPISGTGLGTIMQASTNILTLGDNNTSYAGTFVVTNGVLRYTNSVALGNATYLYATNGGTLDLNDIPAGPVNIAISGAGYLGQGALANLTTTWPAYPYQIAQNITLVGDAYIGANGRWDVTNAITGNDFTLTKVGTSQITLIGINGTETTTGLGNINIFGGNLTFQQNIDMGDPNKTCLVESNASLGFWASANPFVKTNVILLNGSITSGGNANILNAKVTLDPGTNVLSPSADLYLVGPVVGTGGFSENGGANLWLVGTNTYNGPTTIGGNSTLTVEATSSLGASSTVEVDGGSTLNAVAPASLNFGSGQALIGNGRVLGGHLNFGSGSTLAVGFSGSTYTLNMTGYLTFGAGSTNNVTINKTTGVASDEVVGLTNVIMGGVLVITNLGNALASGDAIKLFSATNYSGTFSSIIPSTPGSGLAWSQSTIDTDGTLRVVSTAAPHIATVSITGTNLVINGTGASASAGYSILTQTNLLQPISNWILVGTGTTDGSGNFSFTNGISPTTPARFYLFRQP
jgi:fibronectin-binding autotransporter adhesin